MIYEILSKRNGQALKSDELLLLCGLPSRRALEKQVETERLEGRVICSSGKGYYLPETEEETRAFVQLMESRAKKTFMVIKAARARLKEIEEQKKTGVGDPGTDPGQNT